MAASWPGQSAQAQYPYQPSTGYQQPQAVYQQQQQQQQQQQHPAYSDPAYQQYYAQYYAAQQQAWTQGQYAQQYPSQAWPQGQYPQHYSQPYPTPQAQPPTYQQPHRQVVQPNPIPETHQAAQPPVSSSHKGVSCYNCGAHDHWGASCPQPPSAPAPDLAIAPTNHSKGPVVTKYAVPPHILAQMRARGVPGTAAVAATPTYQPPQSPGWQQWPTQTFAQAQVPSPHPQQTPQGVPNLGSQNSPPNLPPLPVIQQGIPTTITQERAPSPGTSVSAPTVKADSDATPVTDSKETPNVVEGQEVEEDDISLLDIPDMPSSYGTSNYQEPKLVAKPLYSVAPEWTFSGFGEITISEDPQGRTHSDYIKAEDLEPQFSAARASANEEDPIFAIIDLNAPATIHVRSTSRDSGRSERETPPTYGSGDTRPTSVDEYDDWPEYERRRRSWSSPRYEHYERHYGQRMSPRYEPHKRPEPPLRQKKRKGRGPGRGRSGQQKKRKREDGDNQTHQPQAKKPLPETSLTTSERVTRVQSSDQK